MKTYPLVRVLLKLYWLLLFIVIGLFSITITKTFFVKGPENSIATNLPVKSDLSTVKPELLASVSAGKKLFRTNCANCHNKNMKSDMTGPALAGVRARWSDYPTSDLYAWVRNSAKLKDSGHPKAVALYAKWKVGMTSFTSMADEDIEAILVYIESVN